jgi:hypothetical protein
VAIRKLNIDIDEHLHNRLKEEAKSKGLTLKAFCSEILESSLKKTDPTDYCLLPLDSLRTLHKKLVTEKPENWITLSRKIDNEIRRRFRT